MTDAALILFGHLRATEIGISAPPGFAFDDSLGGHVGQYDNIEFFLELAFLKIFVVQPCIPEFEIVEDEAGPAFVHAGDIGLVNAQARAIYFRSFHRNGFVRTSDGDFIFF